MKLYYRSGLIWNFIYFLILSIVFLYIVNVIGISQSPFVFKSLENYLMANKSLLIFSMIVILSFFHLSRVSKILFFTYGIICIFYAIYSMYYNFSKISLVLLSFYILIFYHSYQVLVMQLNKSYYRHKIKKNRVFDSVLKKIRLNFKCDRGIEFTGYLLNWDEDSCFVKLENNLNLAELSNQFYVFSELKGYILEDTALLVTVDDKIKGIGIKFLEENSILGWKHFSNIMDMLGYKPELIK